MKLEKAREAFAWAILSIKCVSFFASLQILQRLLAVGTEAVASGLAERSSTGSDRAVASSSSLTNTGHDWTAQTWLCFVEGLEHMRMRVVISMAKTFDLFLSRFLYMSSCRTASNGHVTLACD